LPGETACAQITRCLVGGAAQPDSCLLSREKALQEAAFAVFEAAPDDATQEWVAQVTGRRSPGLWS